MKKLSKEQCRLRASNAAHKALKNRADGRGDHLKKIYHGSCIIRQEKAGRVFTPAERKKVFDSVFFALKYREFILGREIYTRDKRDYLVSVYGKKQ